MTGADDLYGGAVFQGAKLFELFGAFQWSWFPADEPREKIAPISVDPDVPERWRGRARVP